jgi:hypothetical protein
MDGAARMMSIAEDNARRRCARTEASRGPGKALGDNAGRLPGGMFRTDARARLGKDGRHGGRRTSSCFIRASAMRGIERQARLLRFAKVGEWRRFRKPRGAFH